MGTYTFECWGSEGGSRTHLNPGKGAYTKGNLTLTDNKKGPFYIYVGSGGNNGGGQGEQPGGGSTDVRLTNTQDFNGWKSRIMVAAGGGGAFYDGGGNSAVVFTSRSPGDGGAYNGYDANGYCAQYAGYHWSGYGASQTAGGACGQGSSTIDSGASSSTARGSFFMGGVGYNPQASGNYPSSGGGGGYYGGGHGVHPGSTHTGGGGGSSFISGHPGFNAVGSNATASNRQHTSQPNHYSGYVFNSGSTEVIDGRGYKWTNASTKTLTNQTKPTGGTERGHSGNGYARVTVVRQ